MTAVWVATVPRPVGVPLEQVHAMLYSYFPAVAHGQPRPYVWRLLAADRVGLLSQQRPTANDARRIELQAGVTHHFQLTYKRVRQIGGSSRRPDGSMRVRTAKSITIDSMVELRDRLIRFVGDHGGSIGFVRLDRMRTLRVTGPQAISLPIVDAEGQVLVTDPERFAALLASGGPGTGKVYGCGAWWLPELMEAS